MCAECTGDIAKIQHILNQPGVDTNIYDQVGQYFVIAYIDELLFFLGMQKGCTPLWYASEQGKTDLVQLLLEYGVDIDLPTDVSIYSQHISPGMYVPTYNVE